MEFFTSANGKYPPSLQTSADGAVATFSLGAGPFYTMMGAPPLDDLAPFDGTNSGPLSARTASHPGATSEKAASLEGKAVFDAGATKMCYEEIPTFTSEKGVSGYVDFGPAYTLAQTGEFHCFHRVA